MCPLTTAHRAALKNIHAGIAESIEYDSCARVRVADLIDARAVLSELDYADYSVQDDGSLDIWGGDEEAGTDWRLLVTGDYQAIAATLRTWGETGDTSTQAACADRLREWIADPGCQSDPVTHATAVRMLALIAEHHHS